MSFLDTPELLEKSAVIGSILEELEAFDKTLAVEILCSWIDTESLKYIYNGISKRSNRPV